MARAQTPHLERPALRIDQNPALPLYLLSLTARELTTIAGVSRISRTERGFLLGYQRGEVRSHINEIIEYLNGDGALLPNSIILAFGPAVTFRQSGPPESPGGVSVGIVSIPLPARDGDKPGWIVDGQQRATALLESKRADWPVPVNAFITGAAEVQRDQFFRVNNTKPLPKGLITELLPEVDSPLPRKLAARRIPSLLSERLNWENTSPFRSLIRRATTPTEARRVAPIADLSIILMLEESLTKPSGCLFRYHNLTTGEIDADEAWRVLVAYWSAVRETFPDAWGIPPSQSRLMHGTGIRAMGRLMDRMMAGFHAQESGLKALLRDELRKVAPVCRWTSGRWEELTLEWDEVQNIPRHLGLLSEFLVHTYLRGAEGAR
jgi:DGQHR domain-containing protein